MSLNQIIESFDQRSSHFHKESSWSVDPNLNRLCAELLLKDLSVTNSGIKVLDYGAGLGALSRVLSQNGIIVDVADVSEKMIETCGFARNRFLVPRDSIKETYDRIILRQVLQYVEENNWRSFLLNILSKLSENGRLLFSQIVPWCNVDYSFWRGLTGSRRKARLSWPTENDFLLLCNHLEITTIAVEVSYTKQSLEAWVREAQDELQRDIRKRLEAANSSVKALHKIELQENGDITWINRWIHIVVEPSRRKMQQES